MFTNFREGGRGKERNIDVRNIDQLPAAHSLTTGDQPRTFGAQGDEPPSQGMTIFILTSY